MLAVLAGPLFGMYAGFALVHTCSITGASISFFLSKRLGSSVLQTRFPEKFAWFESKITENQDNLFYYFLFLRLAPVAPNLFLNMAAGLVGVPYGIFLLASLIG